MDKTMPICTEKPIHLSVQFHIPAVSQLRVSAPSMVSYRRLLRDMSSWVWVSSRMNTSARHSEKVFLSEEKFHVKEFPVFQLVPVAFHPVTLHHWEVCGSIFFTSFIRYIYTWIRSPSLLVSRLNSPSSVSLLSNNRWSSPFTIFISFHWSCSCMSLSFLYRWAHNWTQHYRYGITSARFTAIQKLSLWVKTCEQQ